MCFQQLLGRFLVLCVLFVGIQCKCTTTFITTCEKVSDISRYGKLTWKNLIIANDQCTKDAVGPPDEMLTSGVFKKTPKLEELYIAEKVTEIQPGAFDGLDQLTYLKLYKNLVKVIPRGAFSNLTQMLKMDLQDNFIENIQHGLFADSSIRAIDLSYNTINNIQVDMLNFASLRKLTFTHNDISLMAAHCFHSNLEYLNLDHNSISDIHEDVLKPLTNLKTLILSNNKFQGLALSYGFPSLEILDLSHNAIVDIKDGTFGEMPELKNLYLAYNRITHLSHKLFPEENAIRILHLHHNGLVDLDERLGAKLRNLLQISLSANPWACACLWKINSYLSERGISQPVCDTEYFASGTSAVCLVAGEACTGQEQLTQEIYDRFSGTLKHYNC